MIGAAFEARLDALLPQLTGDSDLEPLVRAQILDLFAAYPVAHNRLLDELEAGPGEGVVKGLLPESTRGLASQRPAPTVTRYSDIHAPARAQAEKRFPVIVGLTCRPSPESAAVQAFEMRADLPVQVRLGPTSLEVLGERVQELTIRPEQDSEPVVFYFKGHRPGPAHIILDFLQGGNFLGQVPLALEITAGPVDEVAERLPGQRLRLPSDVPPPDRILFIHYDRFEGQPSLFFTLDRAGAGSRPFPPLPLEADPAQAAARLYDGLTSLQARRCPRRSVLPRRGGRSQAVGLEPLARSDPAATARPLCRRTGCLADRLPAHRVRRAVFPLGTGLALRSGRALAG